MADKRTISLSALTGAVGYPGLLLSGCAAVG